MTSIDDVLDAVVDVGGQVTGVDTVVDNISDFLGVDGVKDLLGAIRDAILNEGFLESLFELLGDLVVELSKAFGDAISTTGIQTDLWDAIADIVGNILDILLEAVDTIADFPQALGAGPLDALEAVRELGELLESCGRLDAVVERILAVEASLSSLFNLISGSNSLAGTLFGSVFSSLCGVLRTTLTTNDDIGDLIVGFIKETIFPKDTIVEVIRSLAEQKLWAWTSLPAGLLTGGLNSWLNDPSTYGSLGGGATPEQEKKFRDTQVSVL